MIPVTGTIIPGASMRGMAQAGSRIAEGTAGRGNSRHMSIDSIRQSGFAILEGFVIFLLPD